MKTIQLNLIRYIISFLLAFSFISLQAADTSLKDKVSAITVEGIKITEIKDEKGKLLINGTAKDNQLISTYMRKLAQDVSMPNLEYIKRQKQDGKVVSVFSISIKQKKK